MDGLWPDFICGDVDRHRQLDCVFRSADESPFSGVGDRLFSWVMLYISFVEMFPEANRVLIEYYGDTMGQWLNVAGFLAAFS